MHIFSNLSSAFARAEHKFLELAYLDLRSRDPDGPAFRSFSRSQILSLDLDKHGKWSQVRSLTLFVVR